MFLNDFNNLPLYLVVLVRSLVCILALQPMIASGQYLYKGFTIFIDVQSAENVKS